MAALEHDLRFFKGGADCRLEFPCGLSEADCAAVIRCESADLQKGATDGRAGSVKD